MSQEDADQPDRLLEREERAALHGRAVGVAAERPSQRKWHTGVVYSTEERRDQKENGKYIYLVHVPNIPIM